MGEIIVGYADGSITIWNAYNGKEICINYMYKFK